MAKIEISANFVLRPKLKYSTWHKTVSGELKGPFELHLDVIWRSEHQQIQNPPAPLPHRDFECFFRPIFNINTYLGNKMSTWHCVDQNYSHHKAHTESYKKHIYGFWIRPKLFSLSSLLCSDIAPGPLENLTFRY